VLIELLEIKVKKIIGFIGENNSGRTTAANILEKHGFYKVSINKKVEEFAHYLFTKSEIEANKAVILNRIRKRGTEIHKDYWLNLVLTSVHDDKDLIVFDDVSMDEVESHKIQIFQIYRTGMSEEKIDGLEIIENDGKLEEFKAKIEDLHKKIKNTKK
jgi:hypothetical protein